MPQPKFELPPQYDPHHVEAPLYRRWLDRGVFTARADSSREPYVIVMPPPNITAILHTGQGLNNVIQDVLIRFERMRGREALWLPGTDHAGIATQNVVERLVAKEGKTRFDLGRDKFVERVWAFVRETGNTRPERLLGGPAVGVNPRAARHAGFVGKVARLPIAGLAIPIVADEAVDPTFGTGFVKVTPAHDATDFEIGVRHQLDMPLVMTEDGRMEHPTRVPKELAGLDRFEAREKIVAMLKAQGLLEKIETHRHALRRCYRCDTIVEPRLSDQWFVKMQPLAEPVLADYRRGAFRMIPERWRATFENWMEHIRDWNISRQLWWGHRIPVFTCTKCKHQWADRTDPTSCPKCDGPVEQDPDVLDTWFSSWLWPFAKVGWPDATPDLARFYPGHTLVTAPEILFFWVARMLMAGYHFMHAQPFATVYLHGTVRDTLHRKMSKSLGNGIDPLDVVRLYGADALRWTLVAGSSLGADVILDPSDLDTTFAPGRNLANKLWNIGRFILAQLPENVQPIDRFERHTLPLADRWILMRANDAVHAATGYLEQFKLDEAAKRCYEFVWGELADWYVEAVKPRLAAASGDAARAVLAHCFDTALRLLHPVVPFITEELWQKLPGRKADELLATASWPTFQPDLVDSELDLAFLRVKQAVEKIRIIRAEYKVPPKARLRASIKPRGRDRRSVFEAESDTIKRLAQVEELTFDGGTKGPVAYAVFGDGSEVSVALEGAIDVQQECRRLSGDLTRLDQQLSALGTKLTNQNFVARAPAEVVAREREKERAWRDQRQALADKLRALGCS